MKIKIMIVDDSIVVRAMLKQVLDKREEDYELVASAKDGQDALFHLKTKEIDVIIMDVEMPRMNGIEALKKIMETNPKPVIMFSSLTGADTKETIEALKIGAMDFLQKPMKHADFIAMQVELHKKIQAAYKAKNKVTMNHDIPKDHKKTERPKRKINKEVKNIALIGSSTGGPKALHNVLIRIEEDFNGAILIVQHMPEGNYTKMLAEHLDNHTNIKVKEAEDGEEVKNQTAYIAKAGKHMIMEQRGEKVYIKFDDAEKCNGHKPSVDKLVESAIVLKGVNLSVTILTGMGGDGSNGAKKLYEKVKNVAFICESEETAIVYGMPKQLKIKVPSTVEVPICQIAEQIEKKINETN